MAIVVRRHPRLWGIAFALALAVFYVFVLRPGRVAFGQYVALPVLESVQTERSAQYEIFRSPRGPILAIPVASMSDEQRAKETAQWSPPAGSLFIFPAMFLVFAFPDRPYWLWLLAYHLALGVVALSLFAIGLGWVDAAFSLYTFSQTYMAETVSLAVPLLLWLAGRADLEGNESEGDETVAAASVPETVGAA